MTNTEKLMICTAWTPPGEGHSSGTYWTAGRSFTLQMKDYRGLSKVLG